MKPISLFLQAGEYEILKTKNPLYQNQPPYINLTYYSRNRTFLRVWLSPDWITPRHGITVEIYSQVYDRNWQNNIFLYDTSVYNIIILLL